MKPISLNSGRRPDQRSIRMFRSARGLVLSGVIFWLHGQTVAAALRTVTNLNDSGVGSLRAAIAASAANDTINFAAGLTGTITLTSGELAIGVNLTIAGPGAKTLSVSANDLNRIFNLTAGVFNLSDLTITRGGTGSFGGGLLISAAATAVVTGCNFADNDAHDGGGIANLGTVTITNTTFTGNGFDTGGGLLNRGVATVVNCTFADNHASIGAGIYNQLGTLTLINSTITGNASGGSPGGLVENATANILNTIIAGNSFTGFPAQPQDVSGTFTSLGHNLIGKTNGSSGWIASDLKGSIATPLNALLGPFQDNGGPNFTAVPLPGSPALDAGASGGPATDQRGQSRPYDNPGIANAAGGNGSDIGACEISSGETPRLLVYNTNNSGAGSLRQAIVNVATYNVGTIIFASNVTGTIILSGGELIVTNTMSILGPGANVVNVSGNGVNRIFNVTNGTVNLSGLTLTNGFNNSQGAGIRNTTVLNVTNCTFAGNSAADGGGIYNSSAGTLTVHGSTFATNLSSSGGALENRGTATLVNSTMSGNRGNNGSAIWSSTVGTLTLMNCTVVRNGAGSDTYGALYRTAGTVVIKNSLIALNSNSGLGGPDVTGTITSQGYNLIGKTNDSTGWLASDLKGSMATPLNPLLGSLQDNGGPNFTVALLPGSPALDAGAIGGPATDQRNRPRPYDYPAISNGAGGNGSDIGAFELNPPVLGITRSGTNVLLFWSAKDIGYTLESATNLPASWITVPGVPTVIGNQFLVTNSAAPSRKFYRLRNP